MNTSVRGSVLGLFAVCLIVSSGAHGQELGTIEFATSGAPAAQAPFLDGVKALHSFQFDEAAIAFREAQRIDADFALAYWGEAMSYNHPLWAQQDLATARAVLERLAPTLAGRLEKAGLPTERALLEAADRLFYGPDDKLKRDVAYSQYMGTLHERWPDDHEIATLYALSLLGTTRPGDTGFKRQALAASIALEVFADNPNHPGAAHFIIHSFDDPDHAPLALPAARAYAKIAPAAAHALHMPSHIFVQLGLWNDVVESNTEAYAAAVEINRRLNLPEGREDFHTLSWLAYGNLMLGKHDEARANVEFARAAVERNPGNPGIRDGYLGMRARYLLETGQWQEAEESAAPEAEAAGAAHASMPGMSIGPSGATWTFFTGYAAAQRGDLEAADAALERLHALHDETAATDAYRAKSIAILANEVAAAASFARGRVAEAVALAKEAADVERTMNAPSGPPEPIKPALELYGEMLLEAEQPADAQRAFEQALQRTPRRTPSLLGLARAASQAGDRATAERALRDLAEMPGAARDAPAVREARAALAARD